MQRLLCFLAGFFMALLMTLGAVAGPATRTGLFARALVENVENVASEQELRAFADETMRYLRGEKQAWEPQVASVPIEADFRMHMAEVRGWVSMLKWIFLGGFALCAALVWLGRPMRVRAVLGGMAAALVLIAAVLVWAAVDFHSVWMLLHRWFIPGGIFPAGSPVMQLFPLSLFFSYIEPVLASLALHMGLVFLVLWLCARRQKGRAI